MKEPCVYILASQPYGTIYIGVTSNLLGRLHQHRTNGVPGFTGRYAVHNLVRFEMCDTMEQAIRREKQLKRWHRQWKINLIETENPRWVDLAVGLGLPSLDQHQRHDGC
ncbi:endonuclease [Sphingobium sp. TA15]|uniref:Crossover junction endodeoxyribonuclease RuvC n=2 Tax=Sphingobium indicum TaxID=332055 RepID=D4YX52_SPHIU|nr:MULTISPECIES: GIY-YIG nuclease family protein [Sphingobium]KER37058.1 crossover junction endodeoxyribonuclease RuvC [Sphingobium indicum F2]BAI94934.1 crossover junction endodeoxyribonuclease RuvC [Sphingobium indicum UT26S]BDD67820.1 endonuclease [Sphingobium sp. TA15]